MEFCFLSSKLQSQKHSLPTSEWNHGQEMSSCVIQYGVEGYGAWGVGGLFCVTNKVLNILLAQDQLPSLPVEFDIHV